MTFSPSRTITKRLAGASTGLALGTVGWLTIAPLVQAVGLKRLRAQHPEMFDGAAALAAVLAAIAQDTTT